MIVLKSPVELVKIRTADRLVAEVLQALEQKIELHFFEGDLG
ncbi:hypothetical protein [Hydrogenibacillus schlegelii]|nr:hypothetical protein [Hydrogenibacillus schlegelii]